MLPGVAQCYSVLRAPSLPSVSLTSARIAPLSVEAGAFGEPLEHVWVTGNANATCEGMERDGALPSGAGCTDDGVCHSLLGTAAIGNGVCSDVIDPQGNSAECLWDGGDCD